MEVEIKVKINNFEKIKKKLVKLGVEFKKPEIQIDYYYKLAGCKMETQRPGSYILRIREQNKKGWFTIKVLTKTTGVWIEEETEIINSKSAKKILELAGFEKVLTKTKERQTGKLGKINICLDKLKGLGNYVEFEIISNNPEKAKKEIINLIKKLELSEKDIEHRGYAAIIFQKKGVKYEGTGG